MTENRSASLWRPDSNRVTTSANSSSSARPFRHVHLPQMAGRIEYAQFLHDASEVRFSEIERSTGIHTTKVTGEPGSVVLELPVIKPNVTVPVVELFLRS